MDQNWTPKRPDVRYKQKKAGRKAKQCICNWKDCAELHKQCLEILPDDHVWNKPMHRFRFRHKDVTAKKKIAVNIKNESFIKRSFSLLKASEDENEKDFMIALHHFSKPLENDVHAPGQSLRMPCGEI